MVLIWFCSGFNKASNFRAVLRCRFWQVWAQGWCECTNNLSQTVRASTTLNRCFHRDPEVLFWPSGCLGGLFLFVGYHLANKNTSGSLETLSRPLLGPLTRRRLREPIEAQGVWPGCAKTMSTTTALDDPWGRWPTKSPSLFVS